jgi:hypothetical protein
MGAQQVTAPDTCGSDGHLSIYKWGRISELNLDPEEPVAPTYGNNCRLPRVACNPQTLPASESLKADTTTEGAFSTSAASFSRAWQVLHL